jgi:hypothetical protein
LQAQKLYLAEMPRRVHTLGLISPEQDDQIGRFLPIGPLLVAHCDFLKRWISQKMVTFWATFDKNYLSKHGLLKVF